MNLRALILATGLTFMASAVTAGPLAINLSASANNPVMPQMGDRLSYHTVIRNDGTGSIDGLIVWISLVEVDPGKEQPVDLEDWSAHKAVVARALAAGDKLETDWPIRLIQAGTYRVVISAATRSGTALATSPFADFTVRRKPVVESVRVLPVALGVPIMLLLALLGVWRKSYKSTI